MYDQEVESCA